MIIGIDLGTTNSLAAYFSEDGPKIIPNRLGKHLTPSVVSVGEDGEIYVGETAKERRNLHPDDTAQVFKRSMGSAKKFNLNEKEFTAEELSSLVLRSLKEDAEAFLGETVEEAVISVPAYFDDKRRKATKRAGELAGLTVERIIWAVRISRRCWKSISAIRRALTGKTWMKRHWCSCTGRPNFANWNFPRPAPP